MAEKNNAMMMLGGGALGLATLAGGLIAFPALILPIAAIGALAIAAIGVIGAMMNGGGLGGMIDFLQKGSYKIGQSLGNMFGMNIPDHTDLSSAVTGGLSGGDLLGAAGASTVTGLGVRHIWNMRPKAAFEEALRLVDKMGKEGYQPNQQDIDELRAAKERGAKFIAKAESRRWGGIVGPKEKDLSGRIDKAIQNTEDELRIAKKMKAEAAARSQSAQAEPAAGKATETETSSKTNADQPEAQQPKKSNTTVDVDTGQTATGNMNAEAPQKVFVNVVEVQNAPAAATTNKAVVEPALVPAGVAASLEEVGAARVRGGASPVGIGGVDAPKPSSGANDGIKIPSNNKTSQMPHASNPHVLTASGLNLGFGGVGFAQGYQQGDVGQMLISGTDAGAGLAGVALNTTKSTAPLVTSGKQLLGKIAYPLMVADGAYQVIKEDGVKHRSERAVAVGSTIAAGMGGSALLTSGIVGGGLSAAGLASGAAVAGVAAVALPAAVAAGTAVAVGYAANVTVETMRIYEKEDQRFQAREDHRHIISAVVRVADRLKEKGVQLDENLKMDLTNDSNVRLLNEALIEERAAIIKKRNDNDGILFSPRWSPFASRRQADRYNNAISDLAIFDAAIAELPSYSIALKQHEQKKSALLALANIENEQVRDAYRTVARGGKEIALDSNKDGKIDFMDYANAVGVIDNNSIKQMNKDVAALRVLEKHSADLVPVRTGVEKLAQFAENELQKATKQSVASTQITGGQTVDESLVSVPSNNGAMSSPASNNQLI